MFRKISVNGFILFTLTILSLTGCGGGGGSTDTKTGLTAPTVTAKSPVGPSVSINAAITVTFSAPMSASTISTSSFTLKDSANNNIAGTVSYSSIGNTATFTPSANLASLTTYTASVSMAVQDSNGIPMASPNSWNFSTPVAPDTTPPAVLPATLSPAINATNVALNSTISVTFSKLLNASTLNSTSFTLSNGSSPITGSVSSATTTVSGAQLTTATFTPASYLVYDTTYTATVTKGVTDLVGNTMTSDYTWSFKATPWTGTKQLGVAGATTAGAAVTIDAIGNIYVSGYTQGGLDGNTLTGTYDFFVTKYNSTGVKQYTRQLGVAAYTTAGNSVTTDANGNVYVAGYTNGGLDGNSLTGVIDFFVTKYNSTGVKQYTRQLGVAATYTYGYSVTTDANGNVYVTGSTFGGLDGNTRTGTYDCFVTKYNSAGVKQFTRLLGVAGAGTSGNSVATDAIGNIYVSGYTQGGLDGNTLTGTYDFFVTKYDSTGIKQYTRQLGVAAQNTYGSSVATDASGNVYVAGQTGGGLDGNTLTGTVDFYVTKYNSLGVKQYTRQLGVAGAATSGNSVATDASGNVYVAGQTKGGLDGNTLTGIWDFFVTKYDSTGVKQYTRQLGVAAYTTRGSSVATDANGNFNVAGYTNGGLDGNTLTGTQDFFVTKYNSSGVK